MPRRPLSITIIAWFFIAFGAVSLADGIRKLDPNRPYHLLVPCIARFAAIVAGAFMLRGCNWARWLLVVWLVFHIGVGAAHSALHLFTHVVLFAPIAYFLFRPAAREYFQRGRSTETMPGHV